MESANCTQIHAESVYKYLPLKPCRNACPLTLSPDSCAKMQGGLDYRARQADHFERIRFSLDVPYF